MCTSAVPFWCPAICVGQPRTWVVACRTCLGDLLHLDMCLMGTRCTFAAVGDCPVRSSVLQCSMAVPCTVQHRDNIQHSTQHKLCHRALDKQHRSPCCHSCKMCIASAHIHGHLSLFRLQTRTANQCKLCEQHTCHNHSDLAWEVSSYIPCQSKR